MALRFVEDGTSILRMERGRPAVLAASSGEGCPTPHSLWQAILPGLRTTHLRSYTPIAHSDHEACRFLSIIQICCLVFHSEDWTWKELDHCCAGFNSELPGTTLLFQLRYLRSLTPSARGWRQYTTSQTFREPENCISALIFRVLMAAHGQIPRLPAALQANTVRLYGRS